MQVECKFVYRVKQRQMPIHGHQTCMPLRGVLTGVRRILSGQDTGQKLPQHPSSSSSKTCANKKSNVLRTDRNTAKAITFTHIIYKKTMMPRTLHDDQRLRCDVVDFQRKECEQFGHRMLGRRLKPHGDLAESSNGTPSHLHAYVRGIRTECRERNKNAVKLPLTNPLTVSTVEFLSFQQK